MYHGQYEGSRTLLLVLLAHTHVSINSRRDINLYKVICSETCCLRWCFRLTKYFIKFQRRCDPVLLSAALGFPGAFVAVINRNAAVTHKTVVYNFQYLFHVRRCSYTTHWLLALSLASQMQRFQRSWHVISHILIHLSSNS